MSAVVDPMFTGGSRRAGVRRRDRPVERPHGYGRVGEAGSTETDHTGRRRIAPAGTSLLLLLLVAALTAMGVVRVRASTEILELGVSITALTAEQSRLLDERRRLQAERAFLRHPDHIQEVATERLHMVPIAPSFVQTIRVVED